MFHLLLLLMEAMALVVKAGFHLVLLYPIQEVILLVAFLQAPFYHLTPRHGP